MHEPIVFLKGEWIAASQASLKIYDLGVVSGATFTEMTRTFAGAPFRLGDHLARLFSSLDYGGIAPPFSENEMRENALRLIENNFPLLEMGQDLAVVCFVTAGESPIYAGRSGPSTPLLPTVCIHSFPLAFSVWQRFFRAGAHAVTPKVRHIPPECIDATTKHRSRLHWFVADGQTRAIDPQAVSLLLDLNDFITESTGANFLIYKDGTIYSPLARNILPGISLQTTREIAAELKLDWVEKDLQICDVVAAQEAWLTSTPYCIAPCTRINHQAVGNGEIGPMFRKIQSRWNQRVGLNIEAQIMSAK